MTRPLSEYSENPPSNKILVRLEVGARNRSESLSFRIELSFFVRARIVVRFVDVPGDVDFPGLGDGEVANMNDPIRFGAVPGGRELLTSDSEDAVSLTSQVSR